MKEKLDLLKKSFKKQFLALISIFNDTRKIYFLNYNDKSKFSFIPRMQHELVAVSWTETLIEVKFNDILIIKNFIKNHSFHIKFLFNYFKRVANHEYGHTISYNSVFYSIFPEDTRHYLLTKDLENITEKDVDFCFRSSESEYVKLLSLKNVDIGLIQRTFIEYWANTMVYKKIDNSPPSEILDERLRDFTSKIFLTYEVLCNPTVKYNENIFRLLGYTGEFFIFNKWQELINIFTDRKLNKLLDLFRYINSFFQKILEGHHDFDSKRESLLELVKILNTFDYCKIVSKNVISSEDRKQLISYINYLKRIEEK